MRSLSQIIQSSGGFSLMVIALILLLGQLYISIRIFFQRKKSWVFGACLLQLGQLGTLLYLLLDGIYRSNEIRTPLPGMVVWFYALPWLVIAAWETVSAAVSMLLGRNCVRYARNHLSANSIKDAVDLLPQGLCILDEEGRVRLANLRMHEISRQLTGYALINAGTFLEAVDKKSEEFSAFPLTQEIADRFSDDQEDLRNDISAYEDETIYKTHVGLAASERILERAGQKTPEQTTDYEGKKEEAFYKNTRRVPLLKEKPTGIGYKFPGNWVASEDRGNWTNDTGENAANCNEGENRGEIGRWIPTEKYSEQKLLQLDDSTVYLATRRRLALPDGNYTQLTMSDVTQSSRIIRELSEKNAKLLEVQQRMKNYQAQASQLLMEQELLNARIAVHDGLGSLLLHCKYYLDHPDQVEEAQLLAMLEKTNQYLLSEAGEQGADSQEAGEDIFQKALDAAERMGVRVEIRNAVSGNLPTQVPGRQPEDADVQKMLSGRQQADADVSKKLSGRQQADADVQKKLSGRQLADADVPKMLSGRQAMDVEEIDKDTRKDIFRTAHTTRDIPATQIETDIRKVLFEASQTTRDIIAKTILECAANAKKHAGGTCLFVDISRDNAQLLIAITNNGTPPTETAITETGGLKSLRRLVEDAGGSMQVEAAENFLVRIMLTSCA